jgi:hypothetical protein
MTARFESRIVRSNVLQNGLGSMHTDVPPPLKILAAFVLLAQPNDNAVAEDLLGLYVGGAIGQSRVEATASAVSAHNASNLVWVVDRDSHR